MEIAIVVALALGLGFLAGLGVGAARAFRIDARRRAAVGASSALARMWPETMPQRSAADMLAGVIRITLGGIEYPLPTKPRRLAREWLARLDERFANDAALLDSAEVPEALRLLAAHTDSLYDLLVEYAGPGILPERDSQADFSTDAEILRAVLEVWAALHPLVVALLANETNQQTNGVSAAPPRSSPTPTAGDPTTSPTPSPTSRSSSTSTRSRSGSRRASGQTSTAGSKP